jgi:hypothetical protein
MINLSLCPNPYFRIECQAKDLLVAKLSTLSSMPGDRDMSRGKVKAAVSSKTPLYVTSDHYVVLSTFCCIHVMVDRQDYRVMFGHDDKAVFVENLDARAARARTREDAVFFAKKCHGQAWQPGTPNPKVEQTPASPNNDDYIVLGAQPGAGDYAQLPKPPGSGNYAQFPKPPRIGNYAPFPTKPNPYGVVIPSRE